MRHGALPTANLTGMIWLALAMAVAYCAPPGAVTAEAIRQAVRCDWRGTLGIELGSVVGDAVYGALAISGLSALLEVGWAHRVLGGAGVALLLYLAWQGFRQARLSPAPAPVLRPEAADRPRRAFWPAFGLGAAIALANPMGIPFWLSFGAAALVLHGGVAAAPGGLWTFFAVFVAGCAAWGVAFTLVLARVRPYLSPRLMRAVSLAAAVALAGFGLAMGAALLGA